MLHCKRPGITSLVALLSLTVFACGEDTVGLDEAGSAVAPGNGAPSGAHFNLNIIGVERGHENEMDPNSRHTIFVKLLGACDIDLTEGDYQVLDWSCLDGDAAAFQLPDPADSDEDGLLEYSVWVRALGKPGGSAEATACIDEDGNPTTTTDQFCNAGELVVKLNRVTGKHGPKFVDVSKELLQVCVDVDDTEAIDLELVPLFDDALADYFWHYDNQGLRLAQFRFYPIETTTQGGDCTRETHPSD